MLGSAFRRAFATPTMLCSSSEHGDAVFLFLLSSSSAPGKRPVSVSAPSSMTRLIPYIQTRVSHDHRKTRHPVEMTPHRLLATPVAWLPSAKAMCREHNFCQVSYRRSLSQLKQGDQVCIHDLVFWLSNSTNTPGKQSSHYQPQPFTAYYQPFAAFCSRRALLSNANFDGLDSFVPIA